MATSKKSKVTRKTTKTKKEKTQVMIFRNVDLVIKRRSDKKPKSCRKTIGY